MQILTTVRDIRAFSRAQRQDGKTIAFVPTMGALHEGHLSLVRLAERAADVVIVSIFVNPTQFGPQEDLSRYPRPFARDHKLLEAEGVDALFFPSVEEMYPAGAKTFVSVEGLSERLDGSSRPGHFRGVATIIAKFFHAMEPDIAIFGQKDAAQHAVIRRMVRDLGIAVDVRIGPIVREADGLALSSRNVYLDSEQRQQALVLHRALTRARQLAKGGIKQSVGLIAAAHQEFASEPAARVDYVAIVDPEELAPVADVTRGALIAVAAWIGSTRLIDNIVLDAE
ncbi:MAG: pantoate--beta-alanine ligase [Acidobacteriaceae bacterium]